MQVLRGMKHVVIDIEFNSMPASLRPTLPVFFLVVSAFALLTHQCNVEMLRNVPQDFSEPFQFLLGLRVVDSARGPCPVWSPIALHVKFQSKAAEVVVTQSG